MIIKVLSENTAVSENFRTEHGLSIYLETGGRKILFDVGAGDIYARNAQRLNVDIGDVDLLVISHGHYDHGGGLRHFLTHNQKAPVYLHPKAFKKHYSQRPEGLKFIGLEEALAGDRRMIYTTERFFIDKGLELFSNVKERELFSLSNRVLKMAKDNDIIEDSFEHEQNLIVTEEGRLFLFAGCAHNGIVNITRRMAQLKKRQADFVLGGFHLYNIGTKKSEDPALIEALGNKLKNTGTKYYTCHCTGAQAFGLLKKIMGDQVETLSAGSEIIL